MRIIPVLLLVALAAGACGAGSDSADDGKVHVVASFYPLAEAARQVGGTDVAVENLTQPGSEPHDLELSTDQVDDVLDADLVVVLGRRFQPSVEEAAERRDGATLVVLDALDVGAGDVADDGDAGVDPHVWLDPAHMGDIVDAVAGALGKAAPERRAAFERRAVSYGARLDALAGRYRDGLAQCRTRTIVTSHAAFGWLARSHDLDQESIAGVSPEQEPDPRRLAALVDLVATHHVTTIFTESLVSPKVAETLAHEAGVTTEVLDPLEGLSKARAAAGDDYVSVMDDNLAKLRAALGCS